jgi:hypothetical protein
MSNNSDTNNSEENIFEEIDDGFEENVDDIVENVETSEYENDPEFPENVKVENITNSNKRDIDVNNHPNVKRIRRKQKIIGAFKSATDKIFKFGESRKTRKRKITSPTQPSKITGIQGSTMGLMAISGNNVRVVGGPPNVSATYQPPRSRQLQTKNVINNDPTKNNALNAAMVRPAAPAPKYVKPKQRNIVNQTFLTPVRKSNVININADFSNYLPKQARVQKQTSERTTKSTNEVVDYLSDSVLKPRKKRGKK